MPKGENSADIIKVGTIFLKTTFKDTKKDKRIRNLHYNAMYICISLYNKSF